MKKIIFTDQAKIDILRIDQPTAMRIFTTLHRFAEAGQGDVKQLKGTVGERRLRSGDYRIRFIEEAGDVIRIKRVLHRSEAYQ
jgi:mRNA-degrading endonuclease RelE of RelBE toxin-antitoxin system